MRDLRDFYNKPDSYEEIEIEMSCAYCENQIKQAYFDRSERILIAFCEIEHTTRVEGINFL